MKYTVDTIEVKHISSLDKKVAEIVAKDMAGKEVKGSMWEDFPGFSTITFGSQFDADAVSKEKNGYTQTTFYPAKTYNAVAQASRPGGFKGNMNAVMEKKAEYIKEAQERKSEDISYFNSVNCAIAEFAALGDKESFTKEERRAFIREERDWFLSEFEAYKKSNDVPFKN